MQLAMVAATERDDEFVAHFPAERGGLSEAQVVRIDRRAAADQTGLCGDELQVALIAQTDGLRRD